MPTQHDFDDEDENKEAAGSGAATRFKEFDCPNCSANNPVEPFGDGDELLCNYCGNEFRVKVSDEGRLKLKEA